MGVINDGLAEEACVAERDVAASSSSSPDLQSGDTQPSSLEEGRLHGLTDDPNLLRDLLQKANGDHAKVQKWLQELGTQDRANDETGHDMTDEGKKGAAATIDDAEAVLGNEASIPDIEAAAVQLGAPQTFFCPISYHLFRDPVLLPTGQTYERQPIERWLAQGRPTCPTTGVLLQEPVSVTPNVTLRKAIEEWAEKHAPWMLDPSGRVVPIPDDERLPMCNGHEGIDRDYAIAVRLQEHERRRAARSAAASRRLSQTVRRRAREERRMAAHIRRIWWCTSLLWTISTVHVAVFVTTLAVSNWRFERLNVNPLIGFGAKELSDVGATNYPAIVDNHEWWRIPLSVFVNAGLIQLEATLAAVWTFGRVLSAKMSIASLGTLYIVSGVAGVLASANFATGMVTAGASGAVFGLLGTVFFEMLLHKEVYINRGISSLVLIGVGVVNVIIGLTPLVDNWCAVGGLVCGTLTGVAIILGRRHGAGAAMGGPAALGLQILLSILVIAMMVTAIIGLLAKFEGGAACEWCRSLTCFDTKWWNCESAAVAPHHCVVSIGGNATATITCPSGDTTDIEVVRPTRKFLETQCEAFCALATSQPGGTVPSFAPKMKVNDGFMAVDNNL